MQQLEKLAAKHIKLAEMVAKNPTATPDILDKIAATYIYGERHSYATRLARAIASHPHTPTRLLLKLSSDYPKEVLKSGIFLADPAWQKQVSPRVLELALTRLDLSESLVKDLASHWDYGVSLSAQLLWELHRGPEKLEMSLADLKNIRETIIQEDETVCYIFASHDSTPVSLLRKLVCHPSRRVVEAVATNPNISPDIFIQLSQEFAEQLFQNPSFALFPLLSPDIFTLIPVPKITAYISQRDVPKHLLEYFSSFRDAEVSYSAKYHVNLAGDRLDNWQELAKEAIQKTSLPWRGIIPASWLRELWGYYPEVWFDNPDFRKALAGDPNLDPKSAALLAEDPVEEVRDRLSQNPKTPPKVLAKLAADESLKVRINVSKHPNTPTIALRKFIAYKNLDVILNLVKHPNTDPEILEDLVTNGDDRFTIPIASNPNTPAHIIYWLAHSQIAEVREAVASNIATPKSLLAMLALDKCQSVYRAVFLNPSISRKRLVKAFLQRQGDETLYHALAQNPKTPTEILQYLYESCDLYVSFSFPLCYNIKYEVLKNPNLSASFLEKNFNSWWQKWKDNCFYNDWIEAIIKNPNTPDNIVQSIVDYLQEKDCLGSLNFDPYQDIEKNFPEIYYKATQSHRHNYSTYGESGDIEPSFRWVLERLCLPHPPSADRLVVLLSDRATTSFLDSHFTSPSWLERYAIAQNPKTSTFRLEHLAQDINVIVRMAAKANLSPRRA